MSECEKYENTSIINEKYVEELQQKIENFQQELYVVRLKLEACNVLEKEFQESNKALEESLAECRIQTREILAEKERKHRNEIEEYENYIATLEADAKKYKQEIEELFKELKEFKDQVNEQSYNSICTDDNSATYKKEIEELTLLFENESKRTRQLEMKLTSMKIHCEELEEILTLTKIELEDKNDTLEYIRQELAMNRSELASLKAIPASDTCKGNSLFAEVEDERKKLLDNLKSLHNKYQETKQEINAKSIEIKMLKAENNAMVKKWENSEIDTLQEKANLLEMYKSRVFNLETKLKTEMKKKDREEIQSTDNSFNYAQSLLNRKIEEIKDLNEKLETQTTQMLVQEEIKHNILEELRYWQAKARSLQVEILRLKMQLETAAANGNIDTSVSEIVTDVADRVTTNADSEKNFKDDFEKKHLKVKFTDYMSNDTNDTKDTDDCSKRVSQKEKKSLKKQSQQDYCKVIISEDDKY